MIGRFFKRKGGRRLRIAYGRIFHEANAFSPLPTTREDFERLHFACGESLRGICNRMTPEFPGFLRNAELTGFVSAAAAAGDVEAVPLFSTLTVSSGPITPECFEWLRETLVRHLRRVGDVDAVYLAMHGSMRVVGLDGAPEGVLLADARSVIGDERGLAVSYDLHANLSPAIIEPATIVEGFRTNPHRDLFQTGYRAGSQLIATLREEIRPTRTWRKLPMVLGGGMTIDFMKPMRPIFSRIKQMCRDKRVVGAHLFMVHPFSDATDIGWAVHVCTDNDPALAAKLADELAEMAWAVRGAPLPPMRSPDEAIDDVRKARVARSLGTVSLVDMGDVVGTGSPGGNTHVIEALLRAGRDLSIYVPIHDPAAIDVLWSATIGEQVQVTLRGTPGMDDQPELPLAAKVYARQDTAFGRTVVLGLEALRIAVTERPPYTLHPGFWKSLGLSPFRADAIIQKALFHYRIFYAASVRKNIPVVSAGPSSLDNVRNLSFDMPVWPRDDVQEWRTFDEARRAGT